MFHIHLGARGVAARSGHPPSGVRVGVRVTGLKYVVLQPVDKLLGNRGGACASSKQASSSSNN